jgi:hypothetical protein
MRKYPENLINLCEMENHGFFQPRLYLAEFRAVKQKCVKLRTVIRETAPHPGALTQDEKEPHGSSHAHLLGRGRADPTGLGFPWRVMAIWAVCALVQGTGS